ncbi:MAG: hypothetical protein LBC39_05415 [Methanobrevibacter sp.]|nr:hypothetical protein [Candidatus Methanovirga aequatorialis]
MIHYLLKIPNFEVETSFKDNLTRMYVDEVEDDFNDFKNDMWSWIKNRDFDNLAKKLKIKIIYLSNMIYLNLV